VQLDRCVAWKTTENDTQQKMGLKKCVSVAYRWGPVRPTR
jgi:hypothetical protein